MGGDQGTETRFVFNYVRGVRCFVIVIADDDPVYYTDLRNLFLPRSRLMFALQSPQQSCLGSWTHRLRREQLSLT